MGNATPWTCPYCNHKVLITTENFSVDQHIVYKPSKYNTVVLVTAVKTCPNTDCMEIQIEASLYERAIDRHGNSKLGKMIKEWSLLPEASVKIFPDYIPEQLLSDYKEACLILDKSAKASATLARRCLQGMIRDFWQIQKARLKDEIDAIHDKVDPATWSAIDAIRQIGNIGAHMEKDINLIIDVTKEEAGLLIALIETLFNDWYVIKFEREQRLKKIILASQEKEKIKRNAKAEETAGKNEE